LRVLNGSNARTYRLVLLREGAPELERITQIGTDHGLLRTPAPVPADGLLLPGRRRRECRRPRKPAPVSAGAALPCRGRRGSPPPDPARACYRLRASGGGGARGRTPACDRARRTRVRRRAEHADDA